MRLDFASVRSQFAWGTWVKPLGGEWFEGQFVEFDTRRRATLACFDFRKVP